MDIATLRHRITIEQVTETVNSVGEPIITWTTFAIVWASVAPLDGREFWASKQINSEVTGKIKIRYLSGINTKMRVLFGSRVFDIEAILNVEERNKEMTLLVKEHNG